MVFVKREGMASTKCPLDDTQFQRKEFTAQDFDLYLMPSWFDKAGLVCPNCMMSANDMIPFSRKLSPTKRELEIAPYNHGSMIHKTLDKMLKTRVNLAAQFLAGFPKDEVDCLVEDRRTGIEEKVGFLLTTAGRTNVPDASFRRIVSIFLDNLGNPEVEVSNARMLLGDANQAEARIRRQRSLVNHQYLLNSEIPLVDIVVAGIYAAVCQGFNDATVTLLAQGANPVRERAYLKLSLLHSALDRLFIYGSMFAEKQKIVGQLGENINNPQTVERFGDTYAKGFLATSSRDGYLLLNMGRNCYRSALLQKKLIRLAGANEKDVKRMEAYQDKAIYYLETSLSCENYPDIKGERERSGVKNSLTRSGAIADLVVPYIFGGPGVNHLLCMAFYERARMYSTYGDAGLAPFDADQTKQKIWHYWKSNVELFKVMGWDTANPNTFITTLVDKLGEFPAKCPYSDIRAEMLGIVSQSKVFL